MAVTAPNARRPTAGQAPIPTPSAGAPYARSELSAAMYRACPTPSGAARPVGAETRRPFGGVGGPGEAIRRPRRIPPERQHDIRGAGPGYPEKIARQQPERHSGRPAGDEGAAPRLSDEPLRQALEGAGVRLTHVEEGRPAVCGHRDSTRRIPGGNPASRTTPSMEIRRATVEYPWSDTTNTSGSTPRRPSSARIRLSSASAAVTA